MVDNKLEDIALEMEAFNKENTASPSQTTQTIQQTAPASTETKVASPIQDTTQTKPEFPWEDFNKEVGGGYKSFDDLRKEFNKIREYEPLAKEHSTLKQQLEEKEKWIAENANPLKNFDSVEDYKEYQLRRKYPDRKSEVSKIMNLDKLSDVEVLKLDKKWNNPAGKDAGIVAYLNKKYGVDIVNDDPNDWDADVAFEISEDARMAKEKLAGLSNEVKLPEVTDPESVLKKNTEQKEKTLKEIEASWSTFVNRPEFADKVFDEIKFIDENETEPYFTFKVDPESKKNLPALLIKVAKNNEIPLNQDTFSDVMEAITDNYMKQHRHKMNKAMLESHKAKWQEEQDKTLHVQRSPNREQGKSVTEISEFEKYYAEQGAKFGVK